MAPLAECALVVAPYEVDGEPAGTIGVLGPTRMDYPQALAAVAVVSKRLSQPADRGLTWTDYYELLGVARDATRRGDQAGLPPAGPRAAPRHQPRPAGRGAVQGDRRTPTRCCPTPRSASATTASARGRRRRRRRPVRFGGRRARRHLRRVLRRRQPLRRGRRAGRAGRPAAPTSRWWSTSTFEEAVFGIRHPVDGAHRRGRARPARPRAPQPGTEPITCPECAGAGQVRRVRQSSSGRWSPPGRAPCSGIGQVIADPCADCRGEGRRSRSAPTPSTCPPASTPARPCASGRGAAGPRGGASGDLYVHLRVAPHERFRARRRRPALRPARDLAQAALGAHLEFETLDGAEDLSSRPAPRPAGCSASGARACPTSSGRRSRRPHRARRRATPHRPHRRGGGALRRSPSCGATTSRRPTAASCPASARPSGRAVAATVHPADHPGPARLRRRPRRARCCDRRPPPPRAGAAAAAPATRRRVGDGARALAAGPARPDARGRRRRRRATPARRPALTVALRAGEGRQARAASCRSSPSSASTASSRSAAERSVVRWDDDEGRPGASSACAAWPARRPCSAAGRWLPDGRRGRAISPSCSPLAGRRAGRPRRRAPEPRATRSLLVGPEGGWAPEERAAPRPRRGGTRARTSCGPRRPRSPRARCSAALRAGLVGGPVRRCRSSHAGG